MDFFYGNFLGLLRVTECHRAHGRKSSVVQRGQVHHKNRRR
jgi:hypothetical protein